jgi:hypothetical protein
MSKLDNITINMSKLDEILDDFYKSQEANNTTDGSIYEYRDDIKEIATKFAIHTLEEASKFLYTKTKNIMKEQKKQIIKLWKELKIERVIFEFSCGGDDVSDTYIYAEPGTKDNQEQPILDYLDNEVYNNVEFYRDSDGHYLGEYGTVTITLEDDEFVYEKKSTSEYSEQVSDELKVELNQNEVDYINKYILSIFGRQGEPLTFNYKRNFILTDALQRIEESIDKKIKEIADAHEFDELKEVQKIDPYNDGYLIAVLNPIVIENNILKVEITISYLRYE